MKTCVFRLAGLLLIGLATGLAPAWAADAEAEGKIEGYAITRPSGGYLGLQIVSDNFKLSFYDAKKQPVPADVARASARWKPQQKSGQEFTVLNPSADGKALVGAKYVRPPYTFIVFVTLLNEAGDAVESHSVNLMAK